MTEVLSGPPKKKQAYTTKQLKAALKMVSWCPAVRSSLGERKREREAHSMFERAKHNCCHCLFRRQVTDTTPTFAVGRTYKSIKSKDKRFLSFDMNEELTILSVEGTPNGLWIARSTGDKVRCNCMHVWAYVRFEAFVRDTDMAHLPAPPIRITKVGFIFTHDFAITADYVNEKMTEFYEAHKDDITKHHATATVPGGDE